MRTSWLTPGGRSSPSSLSKTLTPMMVPVSPWGTFREVSRTSRAFSPKMARNRRSSGVSSVSPFVVVTLPRHEGHEQVAAQSHLATVGSGAISNDVASLEARTLIDQDPLVIRGALVGSSELRDPVGLLGPV